jgi:hypothetical protein
MNRDLDRLRFLDRTARAGHRRVPILVDKPPREIEQYDDES